VLPRYTYQRPDEEKIEENMMDLYVRMYRKFLKEREEIPDGNFSEVKYEDLTKRPVQELRRVYKELGLKTFKQYNETIRKYIEKYGNIKTSKYQMDEEIKSKIYKKWAFAFDAFGYEP
ncbi:MAG TPA: sulfotransferase, partial [Thermoplasmatales archaeon]|nr:sulfotransferase [Thermoplasmatales archaeon]